MNKYLKCFLAVVLILSLGCSSTSQSKFPKDIIFEGKGQNWEAQLTFKYTDSFTPITKQKGRFETIIYYTYIIKKIDAQEEKVYNFDYQITKESGSWVVSGESEDPKENNKPFVISRKGSSGSKSEIEAKDIKIYRGMGFPQKDEKYILIIKWNGQEEKVILTSK